MLVEVLTDHLEIEMDQHVNVNEMNNKSNFLRKNIENIMTLLTWDGKKIQ